VRISVPQAFADLRRATARRLLLEADDPLLDRSTSEAMATLLIERGAELTPLAAAALER
jgi:hypothetical protein